MALLKSAIFFLINILCCYGLYSQRHNFISYNIDEGLLQSQVFTLAQADDRQLWMSTYSGISRFDGKTFHNYTTAEGLSANYTYHFILDNQQRVWAITNSDLNLIERNGISVYPLPEKLRPGRGRLAITAENELICLLNGSIYIFSDNKFKKADFKNMGDLNFSGMITSEKNIPYLLSSKRILYKYNMGELQQFVSLSSLDSAKRIIRIYVDSTENTWVLTSNELFVKYKNSPDIESWFRIENEEIVFRSMAKDKSGNFWLGANMGAYKIKPDKSFIYFNERNGFGNYWIADLLADKEGNIWLATDGSGLFRYPGGIFTFFDHPDIPSKGSAIALTNDKHSNLWFGNNGNDFCFYNGNRIAFPFRGTELRNYRINTVFASSAGVTWVGTGGGGLWKYEKGKISKTSFDRGSVTGIYEEGDKIFFSTNEGVLIYQDGEFKKRGGINEFTSSVFPAGKDSLFVAARSGLLLLHDTVKQNFSWPDGLKKNTVSSFEKLNDKIFIGTIGGGIFIWNKANHTFKKITTMEGLASNAVYVLRADNKGQLWAGTGKGVSRIISSDNFNTLAIRTYGKEQGFTGLECNQNAIAVTQDNSVWFGTVKGIYRYHPSEDLENSAAPKLALQAVKLFSKALIPGMYSDSASYSPWFSLPQNLILPSGKNHITFDFAAIGYGHHNIRYSYFLEGLEKGYSPPDFTNSVVYSSLPHGSYTFKVKAMDEGGRQLGDVITYSFIIKPAFYQTLWFKLLLLTVLTGTGLLIYTIRKRILYKQKMMLEKLRTEEQNKIRIKTAQDFHDEMGNKLARITVLSDILKSKLPAHEEAQSLARKIQENTSLLYQGTKDIIWSLDPQNDNLYFLIKHINDFAVDFFHDTDIEFEPVSVSRELMKYFLPMDYARNIIMINKEVFTNILKHSRCNNVKLDFALVEGSLARLSICDNGTGFETKLNIQGNGLINMQQRAKYLGADLQIQSGEGLGTCVTLVFRVPPNENVK